MKVDLTSSRATSRKKQQYAKSCAKQI